ncbi:phosphodiesterase [Pseudoalteromonas rubra]|uniref:Phosphodiesterase n=1 Tax=Pseudoalteromonas rubra TaxID=43658 RepID=A0A5S3WML2_9GAMM|nr:HD-GYP domain-containing protein [Pseudoalteromonas rubra]TMP29293.1 phosphodiesterase [Pseudoalteromonas rubra]TMP34102.1 phosphodiesterase [Pseudoalteromonas rubra]
MKTITINDLKPGMFVVSVTRQAGHVRVKSQGWVRTEGAIGSLQKAGVLEVEIDPDKTLQAKTEVQSEQPNEPHQDNVTVHDPWHKSTSVEAELGRASALYEEAKGLQEKAFADVKAGKAIAVEEFKQTASGFIDSIFRNQDALACIARIREKDSYLLEHSLNVSILMSIFAKHLGLERDIIEQLATGALLHDIGKIKVPNEILNKPGKLTDNEYQQMMAHAKYSYEIVGESGLGQIATEIAGFHHERLDGSGYPFGKQGDDLSQYVRMAAIVDVYDALTAERVYKVGLTPIRAFRILKEGTPAHYDADLLAHFINCIGVYPVGTLVKLKSQRIGVVASSNPHEPLKPVVKVFYHAKNMLYTEVKDIDLADKRVTDELEAAIKPEEFSIDLIRFFRHTMMP